MPPGRSRYRGLLAKQGAEGVHVARREHPDLILLDIRMPIMDGWQAVRYLRSFPSTRHIPVCGISACNVDDAEMAQISEIEFDHFLMKPIDPRQVVAEVEDLIGPPGQSLILPQE